MICVVIIIINHQCDHDRDPQLVAGLVANWIIKLIMMMMMMMMMMSLKVITSIVIIIMTRRRLAGSAANWRMTQSTFGRTVSKYSHFNLKSDLNKGFFKTKIDLRAKIF